MKLNVAYIRKMKLRFLYSVKGLVRAETALEGNNNKGPLEAGRAHAGPQAPRLLQGKRKKGRFSLLVCVSVCVCVSPKDCGSYLSRSTPSHCTRSTPHHHNSLVTIPCVTEHPSLVHFLFRTLPRDFIYLPASRRILKIILRI
jgi:hypothetical protein